MKRNFLLKAGITLFSLVLITGSLSAQLNKPRVLDISGDQYFVFVTKANPKFEKPERVVNSDFKVGEEAFDPYKIHEYTTWRFKTLYVANNDGTSTRYVAIINNETGMYYHRNGDMKSKEEFDKATARGEDGHFKDFWEAMKFYFQPEVREWPYIWLRIPNNEDKSLVVTQMTWNTRDFKLVLVNN